MALFKTATTRLIGPIFLYGLSALYWSSVLFWLPTLTHGTETIDYHLPLLANLTETPKRSNSPKPPTADRKPLQSPLYVSDQLSIAMRAGKGLEYRIVRYLTSGTQLTLITLSEDGTWYQVSDQEKEGWVEAKDISSKASAKIKLALAQTKLNQIEITTDEKSKDIQALQAKLTELTEKYANLKSNHDALESKHHKLKQISSNAVMMNDENEKLQMKLNNLETSVEELQTINAIVTNDGTNEGIYRGVIAVGFGVFIAIFCQRFARRQRRDAWD